MMADSDDIARLKEQNRDLEARLEKCSNEIRFYRELGQAMSSTLDMHELLDLVADWTRKLINADLVVIPLINNDKQEYYYAAASGEGTENIVGVSFALDVGMCGWVLTHKQPLVFAEGHEFLMEKKTVWEEGHQSALLVPLIGKNGIVGGLSALGKKDGKCFSQDDINALTLFANSVSPAIENVELFNKINQMVNTLEQQVAYRTQALQKSTQTAEAVSKQLLHAQEIAHLGNWEWNIITGDLSWSDEIYRIFGLSHQQFGASYQAFLEAVHPSDRSKVVAAVNRAVNDPHYHYSIEHRVLRPDGCERTVHEVGEVLWDKAGRAVSMTGTVLDISERKQTEAELVKYRNHLEELVQARTAELEIARDNAEAANRAKNTFIATMSHELRTPLNAILGFSELMTRDDKISVKQKENLDIINRSGLHLLNMINDVLDISKIEAGRLELNSQAFDLLKLLHDISDTVKVRAANKRLAFSMEISPEVPQFIKTDSGKLRQVLLNLLENALKFTAQGQVILRTHILPLPAAARVMLEIEVIDSGIGIPADQLDGLFKPFVQLARKDAGLEGTGLGLAMSKSLVERLDGQISVSSVPEEGSRFKIALPVAIADAGEVTTENQYQTVQGLAPNQPAWRLLVVDDNANNRLLLETTLTQVGFQVETANNGQEAIDKFIQWRPALCWMDMSMPVMDGYQATAKIRQLPGGDALKIIAVTASAFQEQHGSIIEAGCDAVIHKPFQTARIFAVLAQHLGVEFIYQDQPESLSSPILELTSEILTQLPPELRQQLYEAASNLDIDETDRRIAQIRSLTPGIADGLQKLAQNYQFEQIIQLIEAAK